MKRLLLLLAVFLFTNAACFAYELDLTKDGANQKKVEELGFGILNANRIEKRVVFRYVKVRGSSPNAYAFSLDHSVKILNTLIPYMDNDAELAGIISHEIAHNLDYYDGCLNGYFTKLSMAFTPKKYEKKADKKAIDFMVKAGYNPVAMIIAMNKIAGQQEWWGFFSSMFASHPLTSERLAYMYEYIYNKYPAYLIDNEYKENVFYQNFLLTSRDVREKIRSKHEVDVSNVKK